jgi:hypothetical protein
MDEFRALCASVRFHDDVESADRHAAAEEHGRQVIARLNADSLRVTPTLTPELYRAVEAVAGALRLPHVPRAYVTSDPNINAAAPLTADHMEPIVILTSGLVELLTAAELRFPIAHELGHTGLRHQHSRRATNEGGSELQTLQEYARQRAAEISADRVAMIASGSLFTAANVMIKTASGLRSEHVRLDVDGFLAQIEREGATVDREWELHATHPMLPMRLSALLKFSESDVYLRLTGTGQRGRPLAEVDAEVSAALADLGHGALAEMEARRATLAATWALVMIIAQAEVPAGKLAAAARGLLDREQTAKAIRFCASFGRDKTEERLEAALADLERSSRGSVRHFATSLRAVLTAMSLSPEDTAIWKRLRRFATAQGCEAELDGATAAPG